MNPDKIFGPCAAHPIHPVHPRSRKIGSVVLFFDRDPAHLELMFSFGQGGDIEGFHMD